ncbi:hypothetical protein CBM2634_A10241 [Cupriavidus taiwanensis]|uniref:Uncharacterized protein n=1 Tax=Cupriavidus taiwanensis TaxID=164546 RepID=A0A375ITW9_9BURK|nr:hypothetical protein CBM2634_A10241 [Cupriavidus taiwanensis]
MRRRQPVDAAGKAQRTAATAPLTWRAGRLTTPYSAFQLLTDRRSPAP